MQKDNPLVSVVVVNLDGLRFLGGLERLPLPARIDTLRGFHRAGVDGKLQLIGGLAS